MTPPRDYPIESDPNASTSSPMGSSPLRGQCDHGIPSMSAGSVRAEYEPHLRKTIRIMDTQIGVTVCGCAFLLLVMVALFFDLPRWIEHVCILGLAAMLVCGAATLPGLVKRRNFMKDELNEEGAKL